jgi:hypothetical protein
MEDAPRYSVVYKSVSAHCCFEATVVDRSKSERTEFNDFVVCECFDGDNADKIAAALNAAATPADGATE